MVLEVIAIILLGGTGAVGIVYLLSQYHNLCDSIFTYALRRR
jgi:hypothetical protein